MLNTQKNNLYFKKIEECIKGKEGEILLATFRCIAEKGIAATTTHAVAKMAGINQGTIHYYFKSKEHLLLSLLEVMFHQFSHNIAIIANCNLMPLTKIDAIIDRGYSWYNERRDEFLVYIAFWAHAMSTGGDLLKMFQKLFHQFRIEIVKVLKEGVAPSPSKMETIEEAAAIIVATIQGVGLQYTMDPEDLHIEKIEKLLTELLHNMIED